MHQMAQKWCFLTYRNAIRPCAIL